ncbi:MAG: MFS transporter [Nitrososphaerota archaeon]
MSRSQVVVGQTARLWASFLCYTISTSMTGPLIGLYAYRLGASSSEIGVIYGIAALTTFLTRLPLASLQQRLGSKSLIRAGVITNSTSLLLYAFSPSIPYMYIASGLRGVGFASFHPPALSEAVRLSGNNQRLGWVMTAPPLGMTLGPLLSSTLLTLLGARLEYSLTYSSAFMIATALSAIAFFAPSGGDDTHVGHPARMGELSKLLSRDMVLLVSSRFLLSYVVGAVTAMLPIYLVEKSIMSEPEVPLLFAWASMFNVLGRPLSSLLKSPTRGMMASSILITVVGILFLSPALPTLFAGMALYGLSLGLFIPSSLLVVQSLIGDSSLTMGIAILTLAIDIGASSGSFGTGVLKEWVETEWILSISAVLAGVGSLLLMRRFMPDRD